MIFNCVKHRQSKQDGAEAERDRHRDWVSWKILFKFQSQLISCMFIPNSTEWLKFMKLQRQWRAAECLKRVAGKVKIFSRSKSSTRAKVCRIVFQRVDISLQSPPTCAPVVSPQREAQFRRLQRFFILIRPDRTWNFASGRLTYVR